MRSSAVAPAAHAAPNQNGAAGAMASHRKPATSEAGNSVNPTTAFIPERRPGQVGWGEVGHERLSDGIVHAVVDAVDQPEEHDRGRRAGGREAQVRDRIDSPREGDEAPPP